MVVSQESYMQGFPPSFYFKSMTIPGFGQRFIADMTYMIWFSFSFLVR